MTWLRCAVLGLAFWGSAASAENWWWLGTFGSGDETFNAYVESESAENDGKGIIRGWVVTHRLVPFRDGESSARSWTAVDCSSRRYVTGQRTSFDVSNRQIRMVDLSSNVSTAEAGTLAGAIVDVACGNRHPLLTGISDPVAHSLGAFRTAARSSDARPAQGSVGTGTGFFVGSAGHVLTSYHVVEGASRIACRTVAGETHEARLVRSSAANDLALLQVEVRPTHFLGFAPHGSAREGDRVFTMGFPAVDLLGAEPRFTDGTISALSFAGEDSFLQTSIPIQPGNSGGPVVTERGQVVGIIAATAAVEPFFRETGSLPQNVNWAVKAEYALPLLPAAPSAPVRTRDEAIAQVRNSICLIVAQIAPSR